MADQTEQNTEDPGLNEVPLYGIIRDVVKKSADHTGEAVLSASVAAVLNQLAEDGKCPDLHDSIMIVIAFHEERKRMNMAELLGTLECIKLHLHEIAAFEARAEAQAKQG